MVKEIFAAKGAQKAKSVFFSARPSELYVSAGAPRFLILQGNRDPLVPLVQSEEFCRKLQVAGTPPRWS